MKLPKNISKVIAACVIEARTFSLTLSQSQTGSKSVVFNSEKKKKDSISQLLNSGLLKTVMGSSAICPSPPYLSYEIHIFLIKFLVHFNSSGMACVLDLAVDFLGRLLQCPLIGIFPVSLQQLPCSD